MDKAQINISMPHVVRDRLDALAAAEGLTRSALIRRALGFMQVADDARARGLYVGAAKDRACLDLVIVPPV